MHVHLLGGALALFGAAAAFSDSSPWILLSTTEFRNAPSPNQIQTSSQVLKYTEDFLSECPTDRYLVVSQPGLSVADLRPSNECAMRHLCQAGVDSRLRGKYTVSEVVGEPTTSGLTEHIKTACAKEGKAVTVDELRLPSVPADDRAGSLAVNDGVLAEHLKTTTDGDSFTVLFYSPVDETTDEPIFSKPPLLKLKRRRDAVTRERGNQTDWDKLPLFEKYQFFTPGIFMALVTAIVLLSILGVGLRALGSLEVSYGAFEKEMGPAAQKKNQ